MILSKKYFFLWCILLYFPGLSFSQSFKQENLLVITDIHLGSKSKHTMDIDPSQRDPENDLDLATFKKLINTISENLKKGAINQPKFILYLGDLVKHLRTTNENVKENEVIVFDTLKKSFPKTPIFYVFGNNDSLALNYGPFSVNNLPKKESSPYEIAQSQAGWKNGFLSSGNICQAKQTYPCLLETVKTQGYYSAYLAPKLRLIVLNTVLFSMHRKQVTQQDALKQLLWLASELKYAKASQESVLLAMHIPPGRNVYDGSSFWFLKENTIFLKLISTYSNNIIGILTAHTHAEELKIIKNTSGKNICGVYFTAALSTSHGNAPSVKTFYFDKPSSKAWQLKNFETFYFYSNKQNNQFSFAKLYDYNSYYCGKNSVKSIFQCLNNVTSEKMSQYFSAGNTNFSGSMKFPNDIFLKLHS